MKVILWILTVVIIICFVPWGVGVRLRARGSDARAVNAGELFGKAVSRGEYRDAYMATVANAKLAALSLSDEQARAMAWERLILIREARRMGIAVSDGQSVRVHKAMGLVMQVFNEGNLRPLEGYLGIGHNRYSTKGSSRLVNAQPFVLESFLGPLAVAHNGNLVNTDELRQRLFEILPLRFGWQPLNRESKDFIIWFQG